VRTWLESQDQVVYTATDAQAGAAAGGALWSLADGRLEPQGALARGLA
jgi:hypothetical protein